MRYGKAKYSTFKYGTAPINPNLLWAIEIDWDDDGDWSGENEAEYAFALSSSRGRDYMVASGGDGFEPMAIGDCTVKVHNDTGRYDPYNADGPLYGKLSPGKKARIRVKNGSDGTMYPVFAGTLVDIIPYGRRKTSDLVLADGWEYLQEVDVAAPVSQVKRHDEAIETLLLESRWTQQWPYQLDISPEFMRYWYEQRDKAKPKLEELAFSGLGNVFIASDGTFKYHNRHHPTDIVATITEDQVLKDIAIPQPWENLRNRITVEAHPQVVETLQDVWTLRETPFINPGEIFKMEASYNNPSADVIAPPESGVDYAGNTDPDGAGDPIDLRTENFTDQGHSALWELKNYDAVGGYITLAKIRGKPITVPNVVSIYDYSEASLSVARNFTLSVRWLQSITLAKQLSEFLLSYLSAAPLYPQFIVEDRPDLQFKLDLMDVVQLNLDTWGISNKFRVIHIAHEWLAENGQAVRTRIKTESVMQEMPGGGEPVSGMVPAGGEILWFGTAGELPVEYQIVSAASGKFVMGAGQGGATDTPAGANSHIHPYSLNTDARDPHTHTASSAAMSGSGGSITHYPTSNADVAHDGHTHAAQYGFVSGGAGGHDHALNDTGETEALPPYRRLYWIKALVDADCPINGIIMWSKTLGEMPENYALCNGNVGTPDMREKFVYIAAVDGDVGAGGGAVNHIHSNPSVVADGGHTHSISVDVGGASTSRQASNYGGTGAMAAPHGHHASGNLNTDADHTHTLGSTIAADHLPQYLYLYYMMRIV